MVWSRYTSLATYPLFNVEYTGMALDIIFGERDNDNYTVVVQWMFHKMLDYYHQQENVQKILFI